MAVRFRKELLRDQGLTIGRLDGRTVSADLRVFQAHGYYDLATPYAWGDYDLSHMTHDPNLMNRITTAYYSAGHSIFADDDVLPGMVRDIANFYEEALKPVTGR